MGATAEIIEAPRLFADRIPRLALLAHMFDTEYVDRQPVEHAPEVWRGEFVGHYIEHDKPPIPVTVHVEWVDGGEGELDGWTAQWTRTHVRILRSLEPGRFRAFWVQAGDVRRRE